MPSALAWSPGGQPPLLPEREHQRDIDVELAAQFAGLSVE